MMERGGNPLGMLPEDEPHLACSRPTCGFRVPPRYFELKPRFSPGLCPTCGGMVRAVDPFTETASTTHRLDLRTGRVILREES